MMKIEEKQYTYTSISGNQTVVIISRWSYKPTRVALQSLVEQQNRFSVVWRKTEIRDGMG
jgi:hypothetical protein